jgi:hypothetical protein
MMDDTGDEEVGYVRRTGNIKFFIPGTSSPERAEMLYQSTKQQAAQRRAIGEGRIRSISFRRLGETLQAAVGEHGPLLGQIVMIILDAGDIYLVCTLSHGVILGDAIEVNKDDVLEVEGFAP